tara:strand:- start:224 stop:589 length:366 start_codon:yes stop_codon:yes gene_type:complete
MLALNPTQEQIQNLLESGEQGTIAMVNLLKFKDRGSYQKYAEGVQKIAPDFGMKMVFWGEVIATVIGDEVEYQTVAIMEYPSLQKFIEFSSSPEYNEIKSLREAGLEGQYLVATKQLTAGD